MDLVYGVVLCCSVLYCSVWHCIEHDVNEKHVVVE